jgi:YVTN family beta-propeller protein
VIAGLAMLVAGCAGATSSSSPPPAGPAAVHPHVIASMRVGARPCAVEGGYGSLWVSLYGSETELKIDPKTLKTLDRIHVGQAPCGIAVGAGSVWVENFKGNSVSRIDPTTDKVIATITTGLAPYDVTFAAGAAWVTNYNVATVTRIDAMTDKTSTIKVGNNPNGIAPGLDAVWVTNRGDGTVSRIDPATLHVTTQRVGTAPSWTAWGDAELWVADNGQLDQVQLATGKAGQVVALDSQPNDGDIVGGVVWVPDSSGTLNALNAVTGAPLGTLALHLHNPFVLAGYAGSLWVVDFSGTKLEQIAPGYRQRG